MSETLRTYTGVKRLNPRRKKRRGWRGPIVVGVILVLLGYGCWTTRDSCPVERLIPARMACHITANRFLENRESVTASRVWRVLPSAWQPDAIRAAIAENSNVPEWVLNNLAPESCYLSANDVERYSDVLLVTRMSRTGCILERIYRFFPGVERDWAGGLNLRRIQGTDLYYAVRGRVLVVSPSRNNLVMALTLVPEDAVQGDALEQEARQFGNRQFWGCIRFAEGSRPGQFFDRARFSLQLETWSGTLEIQASFRPEFISALGDNFAQVRPVRLIAPPEGMVEMSGDFGMPVLELWAALNRDGRLRSFLPQWLLAPSDAPSSASLANLVGRLGPGIRLSWRGVDLNAIIPYPDIVATFDAPGGALVDAFAGLPPMAEAQPWDPTIRYDGERQRIRLPFIGDPSMQPTGGVHGHMLLLAASEPVAEQFLAAPPDPQPLPEPGNLYVRATPYACAKGILDAAVLLAEAKLIRGHTPQSLQDWAKPALDRLSGIEAVSLRATHENGEVRAIVSLTCAR